MCTYLKTYLVVILTPSLVLCANNSHHTKKKRRIYFEKRYTTSHVTKKAIEKKFAFVTNNRKEKHEYNKGIARAKSPKLLEKAKEQFTGIPGFSDCLDAIDRQESNPSLHGFYFELEAAYALATRARYIISAFNQKKSSREKLEKEFDIITHNRRNIYFWIECKHINWHDNQEKLITQFLTQQKLVEQVNTTTFRKINYLVLSKTEIPNDWKVWFAGHNILAKQLDEHIRTYS